MRAAIGIALFLMAAPAAAENNPCSSPAAIKEWMRYEWWGATVQEIEAGAETASISVGVRAVSGERMTPEGLYLIFTNADGDRSRIAVFVNGCYSARTDVPTEMVRAWIARARA